MPVNHTITIKFKDASAMTDEKIQVLNKELQKLVQIEGVISVTSGRNFTDRAPFDFIFTVIMKDKETLERYGPHPVHIHLKDNVVLPIRENILAFDYEY